MAEKKTAWDKFLDFGKGWGLIIAFIGAGITIGIKMETRIFSSSGIKYETEKLVQEGPTAEQKQRAYLMDSLDKASAIETRALRLKEQLKRDSAKAVNDSIMLDYVQKNSEQIFQIKEELEKQQ